MKYKFIHILIVSISLLVLVYILVVYLGVEDQNPTYKTVPEGPKIFNGKADKLEVVGLLHLSMSNDLTYASGGIEKDQNYYSVVIGLSLLNKAGIKFHNNFYEKVHKVKISNQYEHFMEPKDFKIYKIVEVLKK